MFLKQHLLPTVLAGLLILLVGSACQGKTQVTLASPEQSGISVMGTGKVTVTPDIGQIQLAAQVTRTSVQDARDEGAKVMDAIRAALKQNGINDNDIATSGFNVQPQYDYRPNGGTPTITGYMVNNLVTVKVRKIETLSKVLDAAVTAGGNDVRVNGVVFTVDQPDKYTDEARQAAVANARAHAEQLAKAAGVSLGKARSVNESTNGVPVPQLAQSGVPAGKGAGPDTPVSPGETEVSVTVSVVYDIS